MSKRIRCCLLALVAVVGVTVMLADAESPGTTTIPQSGQTKDRGLVMEESDTLGMVIHADKAQFADTTSIRSGTKIRLGDSFSTAAGGALWMLLGTTHISLFSRSSVLLSQVADVTHIKITEGTVSFASTLKNPLAVETPVGLVHARAGQEASGEVMLTGSNSIAVASQHGTLVLDYEGETHSIAEGKAYNVTSRTAPPLSDTASAAADGRQSTHETNSSKLKDRLTVEATKAGGVGNTAGCFQGYNEQGFCNAY